MIGSNEGKYWQHIVGSWGIPLKEQTMQITCGLVDALLMKYNYPIRMLTENVRPKHLMKVYPAIHTVNLDMKHKAFIGPQFQYMSVDIPYKKSATHIQFSTRYIIRKNTAIVRFDVSERIAAFEPTWLVREDDFISLFHIPYETPPTLMEHKENHPVLADWLEDMRDNDNDSDRKYKATLSLDSLRSFLNGTFIEHV